MHDEPGPSTSALTEDDAWALLDGLRRIDGVRAVTVLPDPSGTALRIDLILTDDASRSGAATAAARLAEDRLGRFVAVFVEGGTDPVIATPDHAAPLATTEPAAAPAPEPAAVSGDDLLPVGSGRIDVSGAAAPVRDDAREHRADGARPERRRRLLPPRGREGAR